MRNLLSTLFALFALFALSTLVWSAGFSFDRKTQLSGRMITPNGDGKNDIVVFRYTNPMDSAVTLKIYGVSGALISTTKSQAGDTQISWNGKDTNGQSVPSGVYIYNLESEGDIYRGTIIVAR